MQVLLAGWRVGGGRVTVLSTKGPRASRHGHLRTWTACANRCPEVSFPPAGRRQCRPTFPRSSGCPGTVEPTTPSVSPTNPKAGTVGQHQLTHQPHRQRPAFPAKKANMHFLTGQRPGTYLLPLYLRGHRVILSAFQNKIIVQQPFHMFSLSVSNCILDNLVGTSFTWSAGVAVGREGYFTSHILETRETNVGDSRRDTLGIKKEARRKMEWEATSCLDRPNNPVWLHVIVCHPSLRASRNRGRSHNKTNGAERVSRPSSFGLARFELSRPTPTGARLEIPILSLPKTKVFLPKHRPSLATLLPATPTQQPRPR